MLELRQPFGITLTRLVRSIASESVEDGVSHDGEAALESYIQQAGDLAKQHFQDLVFDSNNDSIGADVLRLLGRIEIPFECGWKGCMVDLALKHSHIEMRDAGVQCAEHWGGAEMAALLSRHNEEVTWLRDYIGQVVEDLAQADTGGANV